eukprot:scaffold13633_cov64-Phaeocystis_antarctica.AAC.7
MSSAARRAHVSGGTRSPVGTQSKVATIACWLHSTSTFITQGGSTRTSDRLALCTILSSSGHRSHTGNVVIKVRTTVRATGYDRPFVDSAYRSRRVCLLVHAAAHLTEIAAGAASFSLNLAPRGSACRELPHLKGGRVIGIKMDRGVAGAS